MLRVTALTVAIVSLLSASTAHAQRRRPRTDGPATAPSSPGATPADAISAAQETAARQHFERGAQFVEQGRWAAAVTELQAARAIRPVPPVLYNLGLAHRALGQNLAGIEAFRAFLAATAGESPTARTTEVEGFVTELQDGLGHLRFEVTPPGATLLVDGVSPPDGTVSIEVDPGVHVVAASAPRFRSRQQSMQVPRHETIAVRWALELVNVTPSGPPIAPIVVMSVGVLGLAAGGAFAIVRGTSFAAFERQHCDPAAANGIIHCEPLPLAADGRPIDPNYRLGLTMGTASVVAFSVGGAVLAAGAIWLGASVASRPRSERSASARTLAPIVTPWFVGVAGTF